jgi:hypothetical protein
MIGDYALQTGKIAHDKARGWSGLLTHVAIVTGVSGILIAGMFPYWWAWMLVYGLLHLGVDQYRTFRARHIRPQFSLLYLFFDQAVHVATIFVIAYAVAGETPSDFWRILTHPSTTEARATVAAILLVFLVWTTAVLEMEAVRSISSVRTAPSLINGIFPIDRLFGATERLVAAMLMLSPYPAFYVVSFIPRMFWHIRYRQEREPLLHCEIRTLVSILAVTSVGFLIGQIS